MPKPNAFAVKIAAAKAALTDKERKAVVHRCITTIFQASAVALNEEFGFGPERIIRFRNMVEQAITEYGGLMNDTDVDYADGKLEEAYKRIMGGYEEEYT